MLARSSRPRWHGPTRPSRGEPRPHAGCGRPRPLGSERRRPLDRLAWSGGELTPRGRCWRPRPRANESPRRCDLQPKRGAPPRSSGSALPRRPGCRRKRSRANPARIPVGATRGRASLARSVNVRPKPRPGRAAGKKITSAESRRPSSGRRSKRDAARWRPTRHGASPKLRPGLRPKPSPDLRPSLQHDPRPKRRHGPRLKPRHGPRPKWQHDRRPKLRPGSSPRPTPLRGPGPKLRHRPRSLAPPSPPRPHRRRRRSPRRRRPESEANWSRSSGAEDSSARAAPTGGG